MRVIYKDKFQIVEKEYPNKDITKPVIGLNQIKIDGKMQPVKSDEQIEYYYINEVIPTNDKPEQFDLIQLPDMLTDKIHDTYKHLKICDRVWQLQEKKQDEIVNKLNYSLEDFLNSQYPLNLQLKNLIEFNSVSLEKQEKIKELQAWLLKCYAEKEKRETEYINNGTFPDFGKWPEKPVIEFKTIKK